MPDGRPHTRAFLFADLRGYSAYTERHGDRAAEALIGRFRRLVRAHISAFQGAEIRTEGDSFYVVFDSVAEAVEAAVPINDAARMTAGGGTPIPVGIGVHAGESRDGEHGIVSSAVNIAARVCSVAPAGQVLVTETVRSLVRTALPLHFTPVGRRRMKGITDPVALYRVDRAAGAARGRWRVLPFVVGAAGLSVLLAVAVMAGRDLGALPAGTQATSAGVATAAPTAAETHDLSRFTDVGDFPNVAERALLDRLPEALADSCERADPDVAPEFRFAPGDPLYDPLDRNFPLAIRAGVSCLKDGVRVHYWQAASRTRQALQVVDLFFNVTDRLSLAEGNCQTGTRVYQAWKSGLHSGYVLCYVSADGLATMQWNFDEPGIYAIATRRGAGSVELYEWWANTGRRLGG